MAANWKRTCCIIVGEEKKIEADDLDGRKWHFISGQQRIPCLLPTAITVSDEVHIEAQKRHLVETGSNHLGNCVMTFIYLVSAGGYTVCRYFGFLLLIYDTRGEYGKSRRRVQPRSLAKFKNYDRASHNGDYERAR